MACTPEGSIEAIQKIQCQIQSQEVWRQTNKAIIDALVHGEKKKYLNKTCEKNKSNKKAIKHFPWKPYGGTIRAHTLLWLYKPCE